MIKFMLILIIVICVFLIFYETTIYSKHWIIRKIIENRKNELKEILTEKDITYRARFEELQFIEKELISFID